MYLMLYDSSSSSSTLYDADTQAKNRYRVITSMVWNTSANIVIHLLQVTNNFVDVFACALIFQCMWAELSPSEFTMHGPYMWSTCMCPTYSSPNGHFYHLMYHIWVKEVLKKHYKQTCVIRTDQGNISCAISCIIRCFDWSCAYV
jgi:hypothetical protein